MELKKGPLSFFQLIIGGLQTANRAFGSALALMGFVLCICIMMSLVMFFGTWIFHRYALLLQIPFSLCFGLLGLSVPLALIQILASRAEKTGLGVWDSLTSSVLPAIYLIVSSLLLAIPSLLLLGGAFLSHSKWVVAIVYVVLFFLLLPFVFLQHVLALRGEDPISALRYSWQLVTAHYFHTLFCIFGTGLLAFFCLLTLFFIIGMLTGGAWSNPAELQMQLLTMPKLYLLLGTVVFFAVYWFVFLTIQSIMTLLFLNLDYCHRQVKTREHDTPLVQAAVGIRTSLRVALILQD